jgi:hypothetical protein
MPKFSPESPPLSVDPQLGEYLSRLEQRLSEALGTIYDLEKAAVEPSKRSEGMIRYADGENWNPGDGEGVYLYKDDSWLFMNFGSELETDPIFVASPAYTITESDISNWDDSYGWGNHAGQGYLKNESDPIFVASAAYNITSTQITNWDTAYGWGDHSTQGYLTDITGESVTDLTDVSTGTFTPVYKGATTAGTFAGTANGSYIKIGNLVQMNIRIDQTSLTDSPAGLAEIDISDSGFTQVTTDAQAIGECLANGHSTTVPSNASLVAFMPSGEDYIRLYASYNGNWSTVDVNTGAFTLIISIAFEIA